MLFDYGANVNVVTEQGLTPLHAVSRGKHDSHEDGACVARMLVERGVDINALDKYHCTALHLASLFGKLEIATLLLDHGANPNAENDYGKTPLHLVSRGKYDTQEHVVDIAWMLLERGVDLSAPDEDNYTALHTASHFGRLGIARLLLEHSAKISLEDNNAQTSLHLVSRCSYYFHLEDDGLGIAKLLLEHSADSNACNGDNATPLHLACYCGRFRIAKGFCSNVMRKPIQRTTRGSKVSIPLTNKVLV